MDQDAFRQLLAKQAASASASSSSSQRQFGKQAKRSIGGGGDDEYGRRMRKEQQRVGERDAAAAAPPKRHHAAPDDSTYVDRADARRRGDEEANEFAEAERLRADFDQRIAATNDDEERRRLREQMAFLGGDARHTILVKGLDYALLEQQKAKLADDDDAREKELESAYASTSKAGAEEMPKRLASKFKPIAQKRVDEDVGAQPEYIWRDGKRMRKKKKKREEVDEMKEESKPVQATDLPKATAAAKKEVNIAVKEQPMKSMSPPAPPAPPDELPERKSASIEPCQAPPEHAEVNNDSANRSESDDDDDDDDDDDEDIFADAGRWKGVEDDDDSDGDETTLSTKAAPSALPVGKRDWFATAGTAEEELLDDAAVLPDELTTIIENVSDAQQARKDDVHPPAAEPRPARLLGLSDSALDGEAVRYMLEREAERAQKRAAGGGDDGDKKPHKRKKKRGGGNDDSD